MRKEILLYLLTLLCGLSLDAQSVITDQFFDDCDNFFSRNVSNDLIDYQQIKNDPATLLALIQTIDKADISQLDDITQKAFYINAYNLNVIKGVIFNYPLQSVMDIPGFFDEAQHLIAQEKMTLNHLENKVIRPKYNDARIHFALVCGAKGCPPIINEAYKPENVDALLERQTQKAINNPDFIKISDGKAAISKIFEWYAEDFGKGKAGIINYLNEYLEKPLTNKATISYYTYDWGLNVLPVNSNTTNEPSSFATVNDEIQTLELSPQDVRYYVSALYDKGEFEVNIFNNFFTQKFKNPTGQGDKFTGRGTFFTTFVNALFGINKRLNVGFDAKIRSVAENFNTAAEPFEAFKFSNNDKVNGSYTRFQPTAIGPRVKYTPFKKFGNISVQQTLYIPLGKNLEGSATKGFADWQGLTLWNQVFYDTNIGDHFGLFAEVDLLMENFTAPFNENYYWQLSTPMTIIPSYFPNNKVTIYALVGSAPQWAMNKSTADSDVERFYVPYNQYGMGFKYQFTKNWLGEILYTEFINGTDRVARTFNFGIRYIKR